MESTEKYALILAGGSGKRLWPVSREFYPKQLIKLLGDDSLLQITAKRLAKKIAPSHILTVTHADQRHDVKGQLHEVNAELASNVFCEPMACNTLPAIAWLAAVVARKNPQAVVGVFPSDHHISEENDFLKNWDKACETAQTGNIVLMGITPSRPSVDYGYIQCQKTSPSSEILPVLRFVEKPDKVTAENYMKDGSYYWNAGIFVFRVDAFLDTLSKIQPKIFETATKLAQLDTQIVPKEAYASFPNLSIDYGLIEKTKNLLVVPTNMGWNDLGGWESVGRLMPADSANNHANGDVVTLDSQNNILWSDQGLIAAYGVKDLVVVQTSDVTMVTTVENSSHLKNLIEQVEKSFPEKIKTHATETRPWGSYTTLFETQNFKIKKITVNPGKRLSDQSHNHRSEHWVVVKGQVNVQVATEAKNLNPNEGIFIPLNTRHRLTNHGERPAEIVEVQIGAYLGEDDIVRYHDDFGRVSA